MWNQKSRAKLIKKHTPSEEELEELKNFAESLLEKLKTLDCRLKLDFLGSSARGTCLKGRKEVDIFVGTEDINYTLNLIKTNFETLKLKSRTNGMTYYCGVMVYKDRKYKVDLVPYSYGFLESSIKDRTQLAQEFMAKVLSPQMKEEIIFSKALLKKVGLYNSDQAYGGFSGLAVETLIYKYGSLWGIPRGETFLEDFTVPGRNLLSSIRPGNLARFYRLRDLDFKWSARKEYVSNLHVVTRGKVTENQLGVRRVVKIGAWYLAEFYEKNTEVDPFWENKLSKDFYDPKEGQRVYLGKEKILKTLNFKPLKDVHLKKVNRDDHSILRVYNYFK